MTMTMSSKSKQKHRQSQDTAPIAALEEESLQNNNSATSTKLKNDIMPATRAANHAAFTANAISVPPPLMMPEWQNPKAPWAAFTPRADTDVDTTTPSSSTPDHTIHPERLSPGAHLFPLASGITIEAYNPLLEETQLPQIQKLVSGDLSEPYSIYCYRYFLYQWPDLCFLAFDDAKQDEQAAAGATESGAEKNDASASTTHIIEPASTTSHTGDRPLIGAIISKLEPHRQGPIRGYIGMLAVSSSYRARGIATKLVASSIDAMLLAGADEIALETEVSNVASLKLYEKLGFLRSKRLFRYYLNGSAAFRLLLYCRAGVSKIATMGPDQGLNPYGEGEGGEEDYDGDLYS
jgi:peptide alpha-N-acetyltransferase